MITDESLLNGSNLNEILAKDMSAYGVTVIWSKDTQSMLPETVNTLISYNSCQAASLINYENVYVNLPFLPNHLPKEIEIDDAIKRLANLYLIEAEKNSIPDSISFWGCMGLRIPLICIFRALAKGGYFEDLSSAIRLAGQE